MTTTGPAEITPDENDPTREDRESSQDLRGRAVRGLLWSTAQSAGIQVSSFAVFLVLGRILSPKDFGLAASAFVILSFLRVIVDGGFARAIIVLPELTPEDPDTAFWTALAIGCAFMALTCLLSPVIALLFHQPRLAHLVQALSVIFIFVAADSTQTALQNRDLLFRAQTIRKLVATLVSAVLAVALAFVGFGVWALVLQQIALEGLNLVLLWRLTTWRPSLRYSRASVRRMLGFGWRFSVMRILWFLGGSLDNFLVGIFLGPTDLGLYQIAFRLLGVLSQIVITPLTNLTNPLFARLQHDPHALNEALYRISRLSATIGLPMYAGIAVLGEPLVVFLFGSKWAPSGEILSIIAVIGVVQTQVSFIPNYMMAAGLIHNEMKWLAGVVAVQAVAFGVTVHWGIHAVAIAGAVVTALSLPARLITLGKLSPVSISAYFSGYVGLFSSTLLMAAAVWAVDHLVSLSPLGVHIAVEIVVGACVYLCAIRILAPHRLSELTGLIQDLRSRRSARRTSAGHVPPT